MMWLRSLLFNVAFHSWTAVLALLAVPVAIVIGPPVWVFRLGRFWAGGVLWLLGLFCELKHRLIGLEKLPPAPFLLASKHQSAWDTMIFSQFLDNPSYVLKRELTRIPFFGWALLRVGCVPVDRSGGATALKSMVKAARARVDEGRSIVIFPEGTRTAPGSRRPYHPGIAALYKDLDIPVVPVALNSGLFWARRSFVKKPGMIELEILDPIPPGLPRREFMVRLEQAIEGATERLCQRQMIQ